MSGNKLVLFLVLLVAANSTSFAQDVYLGVSYDTTTFDGTEKILAAYDITEVNQLNIDDEANGFTFTYGKPLKNNLVLEYTYAETGELSISAPVGATFTRPEKGEKTIIAHSELKAEASIIGVAALAPVFKSDFVSSYVRLGLDYYETEITAVYGKKELGGLKYGTSEGFAPSLAVGADVKVSKDLSLRAQYKLFGFDVMDDYKVDTLSLGILRKF